MSYDQAIEEYNANVDRFNGDVIYDPGYLDDCPASESEPRYWQFRIAVVNDPENLIKAAKTVAPILIPQDLSFKCYILGNNASTPISHWDGTGKVYDSQLGVVDLDRDQRGKEICVYMRFDRSKDGYEKSPEEFKNIMMECWRALQKANVEFGYVTPPTDEKEVETVLGVGSPFHYSAGKPYTGRHGILNANGHNPHGYNDPLTGVEFSARDLKKGKIDDEKLKLLPLQRLSYHIQHFEKAKKEIASELLAISRAVDTGVIYSLDNHIADMEKCLQNIDENNLIATLHQNIETLEMIFQLCPHQSDKKLSPFSEVVDLYISMRALPTDVEMERLQDKFVKFKACVTRQVIPEISVITQEFSSDAFIMSILKDNGLDGNLDDLVKSNPARMQKSYRRLVHLKHEDKSIQKELARLKTFIKPEIANEQKRCGKWRLFMHSGNNKAEALSRLATAFDNANSKTDILSVITNWKKDATGWKSYKGKVVTNEDVVKQHRNAFFADARSTKSTAERFVDSLDEKINVLATKG